MKVIIALAFIGAVNAFAPQEVGRPSTQQNALFDFVRNFSSLFLYTVYTIHYRAVYIIVHNTMTMLMCVSFFAVPFTGHRHGSFRPCQGPKRLWCSQQEEGAFSMKVS
jgi:hypothetical protein